MNNFTYKIYSEQARRTIATIEIEQSQETHANQASLRSESMCQKEQNHFGLSNCLIL